MAAAWGSAERGVLTQNGRRARTAVTLFFAALLLAGTFVGQDGDFPFGPFRMYATRDDPNGTVLSTRVEAVDATGRTFVVSDRATGLRRAEIEGQTPRFTADPSLLAAISLAHDRLRPNESEYVTVRIVQARYQLRDSRPSGQVTDTVVASWSRP